MLGGDVNGVTPLPPPNKNVLYIGMGSWGLGVTPPPQKKMYKGMEHSTGGPLKFPAVARMRGAVATLKF